MRPQDIFPDYADTFGPLLILEHEIEKATRRKPVAIMLPLSLHPEVDVAFGRIVVRGDRTALIYEP